MDQLLIIITALIFYALGRYNGQELEVIKKVKKQLKNKIDPPIVGPIDYATQEDIDYRGSEKEKIDREMTKNINSILFNKNET